jgi:hypothetical protein
MIEEEYICINGKYIPLSEYPESIPEILPRKGWKLSFSIKLSKIMKLIRRIHGIFR